MFRRWISNFWKNNKDKLIQLGKGAFILIIISFFATVMMSSIPQETEEVDNKIYKPTTTVITGNNISTEIYENDSNVIEDFISYCNSNDIDSAYNLLSDDCKNIFFPTIKDFKNNYIKKIFNQKKEYNLQSWIQKDNINIYRIRMLNDVLSTGDYTNSEKYEDYIAINNRGNESKISINGFVKIEDINVETNTNEFYAKVLQRNVYMDYEEYIVTIKNLTDNTVLMDSLETVYGTVLFGENDVKYYIENVNETLLLSSRVYPNNTIKLTIKFKKNYSTNVKSSYIEFRDIIRNVNEYNNTANYEDRLTLKINL